MLDTVAAARVARRERLKRIADAAVPDSPISFRPPLKNTRPFGVLPQEKRARIIGTLIPPPPPRISYDEVTIMPPIRKPRSEDIKRAVCSAFSGLGMDDMKSGYRNRYIAEARQLCMWLHKRLLRLSLPVIGRLHDKDHSTALHSIRRVDARIKSDAKTTQNITRILAFLRNHRFAVPETVEELFVC